MLGLGHVPQGHIEELAFGHAFAGDVAGSEAGHVSMDAHTLIVYSAFDQTASFQTESFKCLEGLRGSDASPSRLEKRHRPQTPSTKTIIEFGHITVGPH